MRYEDLATSRTTQRPSIYLLSDSVPIRTEIESRKGPLDMIVIDSTLKTPIEN